jgi:hypothetical protein
METFSGSLRDGFCERRRRGKILDGLLSIFLMMEKLNKFRLNIQANKIPKHLNLRIAICLS